MVVHAYRIEKKVSADKTVTLTGLPFAPGERVEILVVRQKPRVRQDPYPLRGQAVHYERPFEGVAETDWDALQ
jgi:hypothetical protein